jgi:hypothetical protein
MQDEVIVVKKNHPHQKGDGGDEVFVFEKSDGFHGKTKLVSYRESITFDLVLFSL